MWGRQAPAVGFEPWPAPPAPAAEPVELADGRVTVDMNAPVFEHAHLPFDASGLAGLAAVVFAWMLIAMTFIDLDTQYLPDDLTLPLLWLGLLVNIKGVYAALPDAIIGAAIGYLVLWGVNAAFKLLRGMEGSVLGVWVSHGEGRAQRDAGTGDRGHAAVWVRPVRSRNKIGQGRWRLVKSG